jgi:hypothetical protein
MLRQTGSWWNRKRLWYYQDNPEKTADKPHRFTLLIGFLSPALAVVAVGISMYGVWTNRQSMQVAQRAYLVAENCSLETRVTYLPGKLPLKGPITAGLSNHVTIRNLGNTPAHITFVEVTLLTSFSQGWTMNQGSNKLNVELSPKSVWTDAIDSLVTINSEGLKRYLEIIQIRQRDPGWTKALHTAATKVVLSYSDIFDDTHQLTWYTYDYGNTLPSELAL